MSTTTRAQQLVWNKLQQAHRVYLLNSVQNSATTRQAALKQIENIIDDTGSPYVEHLTARPVGGVS
jgi:hypothetical protein